MSVSEVTEGLRGGGGGALLALHQLQDLILRTQDGGSLLSLIPYVAAVITSPDGLSDPEISLMAVQSLASIVDLEPSAVRVVGRANVLSALATMLHDLPNLDTGDATVKLVSLVAEQYPSSVLKSGLLGVTLDVAAFLPPASRRAAYVIAVHCAEAVQGRDEAALLLDASSKLLSAINSTISVAGDGVDSLERLKKAPAKERAQMMLSSSSASSSSSSAVLSPMTAFVDASIWDIAQLSARALGRLLSHACSLGAGCIAKIQAERDAAAAATTGIKSEVAKNISAASATVKSDAASSDSGAGSSTATSSEADAKDAMDGIPSLTEDRSKPSPAAGNAASALKSPAASLLSSSSSSRPAHNTSGNNNIGTSSSSSSSSSRRRGPGSADQPGHVPVWPIQTLQHLVRMGVLTSFARLLALHSKASSVCGLTAMPPSGGAAVTSAVMTSLGLNNGTRALSANNSSSGSSFSSRSKTGPGVLPLLRHSAFRAVVRAMARALALVPSQRLPLVRDGSLLLTCQSLLRVHARAAGAPSTDSNVRSANKQQQQRALSPDDVDDGDSDSAAGDEALNTSAPGSAPSSAGSESWQTAGGAAGDVSTSAAEHAIAGPGARHLAERLEDTLLLLQLLLPPTSAASPQSSAAVGSGKSVSMQPVLKR